MGVEVDDDMARVDVADATQAHKAAPALMAGSACSMPHFMTHGWAVARMAAELAAEHWHARSAVLVHPTLEAASLTHERAQAGNCDVMLRQGT